MAAFTGAPPWGAVDVVRNAWLGQDTIGGEGRGAHDPESRRQRRAGPKERSTIHGGRLLTSPLGRSDALDHRKLPAARRLLRRGGRVSPGRAGEDHGGRPRRSG